MPSRRTTGTIWRWLLIGPLMLILLSSPSILPAEQPPRSSAAASAQGPAAVPSLGSNEPEEGPGFPLATAESEASALLTPLPPLTKGHLLHNGPNPRAHQQLLEKERAALEAGSSPQAMSAGLSGSRRILVLLVEFSGRQTFSHAIPDPNDPTDCITPTITIDGPRHNSLPRPTPPDNATLWVPDFSPDHYRRLLFDTGPQGGIGIVRPDLYGGQGVDLSGLTMANYYLEQSEGAFLIQGDVVGWLSLPTSIGEYGADSCGGGPGSDDFRGPVWRLVQDTAAALNAQNPNFDWYRYDSDRDGYLDHLMVVHAGLGQEASTGAIADSFSIWSHSWDVAAQNGLGPGGQGGYQVAPPTPENPLGVWILNYTLMPENGGVGVFAHEFGHDLGLPDIYSQDAANSTELWTLMAAGSWLGRIPGTQPGGLGLWERWVLGWADPVPLGLGIPTYEGLLGQAAVTPAGTSEGVRVGLPDQQITVTSPRSGQRMWWGNQGNRLDHRLTHASVDLTGKGVPVTLTFQTYFDIEQDWDYGYVEVSTDGGQSWVALDDIGDLTTNDNPHGQNRGNGITGTRNWVKAAFDLSPYAGMTIALRFRYVTDAAIAGNGWFIDDIEIRDAGGTFFRDTVETGAGPWVAMPAGGWIIEDGTLVYPHYYLVEWRNYSGFDRGLMYGYHTVKTGPTWWQVEPVALTAPGMLVWYRNSKYDSNAFLGPNLLDPPSIGPKGFLLLVDAHPWPLRWPDGTNLSGRIQGADAAFAARGTTPLTLTDPRTGQSTTFGPRPAMEQFHDVLGYYPGVNYPGSGDTVFFSDWDASVVIPAAQNYSLRITHPDGSPYPELWGSEVASYFLGTGDPGSRAYGLHMEIVDQAADGSWGRIRIRTDKDTLLGKARADRRTAQPGDIITYTIALKDTAGTILETGEPLSYSARLSSPIPAGTTYVPGSVQGAGASYDATANRIVWRGALGGLGLDTYDAVITFQVQVDQGIASTISSTVTLDVGFGNHKPAKSSYTFRSTVQVVKPGDVDCSGNVDALDALMILRYSTGIQPYAGCIASGDVNCDGVIDGVDALIILRRVTGLPLTLPPGCPALDGASP